MFDSKYHFSLDINPQGININPSSITREGVSQGSYLYGEVHTFYYVFTESPILASMVPAFLVHSIPTRANKLTQQEGITDSLAMGGKKKRREANIPK